MHFEELWELCEQYHKDIPSNPTASIIDELVIKINVYKVILTKFDSSIEDKEKLKHRLFGEVLFTLTNLSLIENIDVFSALLDSFKENKH